MIETQVKVTCILYTPRAQKLARMINLGLKNTLSTLGAQKSDIWLTLPLSHNKESNCLQSQILEALFCMYHGSRPPITQHNIQM